MDHLHSSERSPLVGKLIAGGYSDLVGFLSWEEAILVSEVQNHDFHLFWLLIILTFAIFNDILQNIRGKFLSRDNIFWQKGPRVSCWHESYSKMLSHSYWFMVECYPIPHKYAFCQFSNILVNFKMQQNPK